MPAYIYTKLFSSEKVCTSKLGRKTSVIDENRRETYNIPLEPVAESDSVLSTFEGESKQFIPVSRNKY